MLHILGNTTCENGWNALFGNRVDRVLEALVRGRRRIRQREMVNEGDGSAAAAGNHGGEGAEERRRPLRQGALDNIVFSENEDYN